eukprot:6281363-Prymnesium_polylepis.2
MATLCGSPRRSTRATASSEPCSLVERVVGRDVEGRDRKQNDTTAPDSMFRSTFRHAIGVKLPISVALFRTVNG